MDRRLVDCAVFDVVVVVGAGVRTAFSGKGGGGGPSSAGLSLSSNSCTSDIGLSLVGIAARSKFAPSAPGPSLVPSSLGWIPRPIRSGTGPLRLFILK